ncbi:MAG: tyrosine-protein kinase [Gaiellales bacterium]|nr:tyrosine-protein kinase [Gaiellales bacterium]
MDLHRYAHAIRRSWWIIVLLAVVGAAGGYVYSKRQTPVYAAHLTFYVGSPSLNSVDANSSNQFAQDRATSYAGLVGSDALAKLVKAHSSVNLDVRGIAREISGTAQLNSVLIDVTIQDVSTKRALVIATGVGKWFPQLVSSLDNGDVPKGANSAVQLSVANYPRVSAAPVSPRTSLNTAIAFALGLLLGLAIAVLRELLDVSVGTAEGLVEVSGVPTLGTIALDPDIKSRPLVVGDVAYSPRAEAMRQLRTNLQFIDAAHPARTVVVTSTRDGEGKSTVSVNLALVVAETGRRVLLIGADLRRPRIGELLGIEGGVGLSNLLAGQRELDEVLQPWGDSGLVVLPCGPIPPNPSELLGSPRMTQLLATCAERFDLVIIDTPPLRPVTDAAVVAANADGAIVVFWHGHTKRNHLQAAVHALTAVNSRVLGCVLNMKPLSRAERRGYATYYGTGKKRWRPFRRAGRANRPAARAAALAAVRPLRTAPLTGINGSGPALVLEPPDAEALAKVLEARSAGNGRSSTSLRKS